MSDIPTRLTIQAIYDKFIETGSVKDRERSGRPSIVTEELAAEIDQVVQNNVFLEIEKRLHFVLKSMVTILNSICKLFSYK